MLKKFLPFIIILFVVLPVALFILFFKDKKLPDSQVDAVEAVPMDAVWVLEAKSLPGLLQLFNTREQVKDDLINLEVLSPYITGLARLDSMLTGGQSVTAEFGVIPGILSLHQTGEKEHQVLVVLQATGRFGSKDIMDLSRGMLSYEPEVSHKSYLNTRIEHLQFAEGGLIRELYISQIKKYVLISSSDLLIEASIRQLKSGVSLNQDEFFRKASSVAGLQADAGWYVNTKRLGQTAAGFLGKPISDFLKNYHPYGSWTELDLTFREDLVQGSGFAFKGDTLAWLGVLDGQDPPKNRLDQVLPANCLAYLGYGFSHPDQLLDRIRNQYTGTGYGKQLGKADTDASRYFGEQLSSAFAHFLDHEAALAWIPGTGKEPAAVVVMTLKSQHMASEKLLDWISIRARKEGKQIQDYRKTYQLDNQASQYIYESPVSGLPALLFGKMFESVQGKYFGFLENELVFSDNPQAIRDMNYFRVLNKTLHTDPVYQSVVNQIGMRNNFVFYLAPFRSAELIRQWTGTKWGNAILKNPEFLNRMAALSMQIQVGANGFFHNFFVKFSAREISSPQTIWESRLDTTIHFKPVFTLNHQTNRKEILLQDEAHNLYLINTSGRQLWKVPLKEAIRSEIFQIDFYKNGKLQFLFSTQSALHLIDRNGNYVANYPVMLRAPASNGMNLFDYDNRKEYRIFVAGQDRGIYVYDQTGALVKGWEFGKTESLVEQEVQHYRLGSRDYIVFGDAMRVYILDRRGNPRVTPDKQFAKSARNGLVLDRQAAGGPRLVGTDVNGMIWFVYFSGRVEEHKTEGYSADHYFTFEDFDGDGRRDYIFADQNRIEVLNPDGKKILKEKTDGYITHPPNLYVFPGNSREIGVVNRNEEKIYLFQADGNQHDGFPLRGRTPFSIGYLDPGNREFNLIVGGDDKFLLNYRVK